MMDASAYLQLLDPERDPKDSLERALSIMRTQMECFQGLSRIVAEADVEDEEEDRLLQDTRSSQLELVSAQLDIIETTEWLWRDVFDRGEDAARELLPDVIQCIVTVHQTMETIMDAAED